MYVWLSLYLIIVRYVIIADLFKYINIAYYNDLKFKL